MMDQETESGVDFSFDLVNFVNGEANDLIWGTDSDSIRYSQAETMLDPALMTGMVLSPAPTTSTATSVSNAPSPLKPEVVITSDAHNLELRPLENTPTNSSFFSEQHNPWGEER